VFCITAFEQQPLTGNGTVRLFRPASTFFARQLSGGILAKLAWAGSNLAVPNNDPNPSL